MVKVFEEVKLPIDSELEVALLPNQPPEAVQELALVDVQVKLTTVLHLIAIGPSEPLALISTVGAGHALYSIKISSILYTS